jgi:hypothetical protein
MILYFELQKSGVEEMTFLSRLSTPLIFGIVWTNLRQYGLSQEQLSVIATGITVHSQNF